MSGNPNAMTGDNVILPNTNGSLNIGNGGAKVSSTNPMPVYNTTPSSDVTPGTAQAVIATTGTAVQIKNTNYVMINGAIITAMNGNNASGIAFGYSNAVTNTTTGGTGNGEVVYPGGKEGVGSGIDVNTLWFNGTAGDAVSISWS